MVTSLGMDIAQVNPNKIILKRRFRYLFEISHFLDAASMYNSPAQAWATQVTRPSFQFDETEIRHVNEIVYYPTRVRYEPVSVTLIDVYRSNQIYNWLYAVHALEQGALSYFDDWHSNRPVTETDVFSDTSQTIKRDCYITMFDGMGEGLERWLLQGCYPQSVNFGDLDYTNNDFATVEVSIRYDRAYIDYVHSNAEGGATITEA